MNELVDFEEIRRRTATVSTNMNNTTTITLNDRFSQIKKPQGNPQQQRGRSRSRSRGPNLQGSHRNRSLLDQLEKQHKMRMALKLKNVSMAMHCRFRSN